MGNTLVHKGGLKNNEMRLQNQSINSNNRNNINKDEIYLGTQSHVKENIQCYMQYTLLYKEHAIQNQGLKNNKNKIRQV